MTGSDQLRTFLASARPGYAVARRVISRNGGIPLIFRSENDFLGGSTPHLREKPFEQFTVSRRTNLLRIEIQFHFVCSEEMAIQAHCSQPICCQESVEWPALENLVQIARWVGSITVDPEFKQIGIGCQQFPDILPH